MISPQALTGRPFHEKFAVGVESEKVMVDLLEPLGFDVARVESDGDVPRIDVAGVGRIAPDLTATRGDRLYRVEVKTKTAFSRSGERKAWQCMIDKRMFDDYWAIEKTDPGHVTVFFVSRSDTPCDVDAKRWGLGDEKAPLGVFAERVWHLRGCIDHERLMRQEPMCFWNVRSLVRMERLADFGRMVLHGR
jgi:hypothetical protein